MKLELKHLAPYLAYELKCCLMGAKDEKENPLSFLVEGASKEFVEVWSKKTITDQWTYEDVFPILRPLSDLTKEINYRFSTYAFTYLFEIGDCDGCVFEFEHGNIKTIKSLENISKYNSYNDINYLPNAVVNMMYEYHFDVFGLIEQGLAINFNDLQHFQSC
ncbi:hypothetical protein ACTS9T_12695 [Empedobacter falsenii]